MPELEIPLSERVARTLEQLGKLRIADRARLLADNQRTLNTTLAADRANRSLHQRVENWNFERVKKSLGGGAAVAEETNVDDEDGIEFPEDEEMQINIDSPTTVHYTQPAAQQQPSPAPAPASSSSGFWPGVALAAGAIGLPLIAAGATYLLTRPNAQPPPAATSPDHIGGVSLMPPITK